VKEYLKEPTCDAIFKVTCSVIGLNFTLLDKYKTHRIVKTAKKLLCYICKSQYSKPGKEIADYLGWDKTLVSHSYHRFAEELEIDEILQIYVKRVIERL
jgi:chromosomal replication initiation ATPase DnaA